LLNLTPETLALGLTHYVVLLFSLSVHESAHGWMALQMGDDTAALQGRVTLVTGVQMNVVLALVNLVPLPPLDGSWVASWGLPREIANHYDRVVEPYGQWILLGLFATGVLGWMLSPFVGALSGLLYRLAL